MKKIILLLLVAVSIGCSAQTAVITLNDGSEKNVTIKATSTKTIFTDIGNFDYAQISKVGFGAKEQRYQMTYDRLSQNGIEMEFDKVSKAIILPSEQTQEEIMLSNVLNGLDKFRAQRETGKTIQLFSLIISVGSALIITHRNVNIPKEIPYIGGGLFMVGFMVDLNAGKHIRFKH